MKFRPHPAEPERSEGVSKDGAASVAASWFETPRYARLLTMRPEQACAEEAPSHSCTCRMKSGVGGGPQMVPPSARLQTFGRCG
jgi:hypothetical protein